MWKTKSGMKPCWKLEESFEYFGQVILGFFSVATLLARRFFPFPREWIDQCGENQAPKPSMYSGGAHVSAGMPAEHMASLHIPKDTPLAHPPYTVMSIFSKVFNRFRSN